MKHLFLDLEDTIITPVVNGWADFELINLNKIRKIKAVFDPSHVSIFSFAIHNQKELTEFNKHVRAVLEDVLSCKLNLVPTVNDDIKPTVARALKWHRSTVDLQDIINLGKGLCFKLFIQEHFKLAWKNGKLSTEVMLLDDTVMNETWEWPGLHINGQMVQM